MKEFHRILVPLDGSKVSESSLPIAVSLASKYGSEVILLRVLDDPGPSDRARHPESLWIREAQEYHYREVQTYLDDQVNRLLSQGIHARPLIRDAAPADDILHAAGDEHADLIVMTSHGRGSPSRWTSGSVADKVSQHSPCPVLLVRSGAEEGVA